MNLAKLHVLNRVRLNCYKIFIFHVSFTFRFFVKGDPFQYSYNVAVDVNSTRVEQSKAESSNGQEVVGQYKVLLPDGRLQTVTYTSGPNGYKATVRYVQVSGQESATESSGTSFTAAKLSTKTTTPVPTTTTTSTTTTSTTTSSSVGHDEIASVQLKEVASIDGRASTSSRSRQRSNRTRGERIRSSPPILSLAAFKNDIEVAAVDDLPTLRAEPSIRRSARPSSLKTTWQFDQHRQEPDDVFTLDFES